MMLVWSDKIHQFPQYPPHMTHEIPTNNCYKKSIEGEDDFNPRPPPAPPWINTKKVADELV